MGWTSRQRRYSILVSLILAASACSGSSAAPSADTVASTPSSQETTTEDEESTMRILPKVTLDCSQATGQASVLLPGLVEIDNVVALPAAPISPNALPTASSETRIPDLRLFAKRGLFVRPGSEIEFVAQQPASGSFSVGWGAPARPTFRLHVPACESGANWLVFSGGYWTDSVGCYTIEVVHEDNATPVAIGVGSACPGQAEPVSRSQP